MDRGLAGRDYPALVPHSMQDRPFSKAYRTGYFSRQMSKYIASINFLNIYCSIAIVDIQVFIGSETYDG